MFVAASLVGHQPIGDWFIPDTTQRHALGHVVDAVDPYWGHGQFMYIKSLSTMEKGTLAQWTEAFVAEDVPNTAGMGRPCGVLLQSMTTGQFGWLQLAGFAPISAAASVAADTVVGIGGAGQIGANANGKQVVGARNRFASTVTRVLTNVQTTNGSAVLKTNGYDGWFVGMPLSGTGIPASTVVAKLDPDGKTVYMGSVIGTVDKVATATGLISATGTWTGYIGAIFSSGMFTQGAIL